MPLTREKSGYNRASLDPGSLSIRQERGYHNADCSCEYVRRSKSQIGVRLKERMKIREASRGLLLLKVG